MGTDASHTALALQKLCVGADAIGDLAAWQAHVSATRSAAGMDPRPRHVTRLRPRREAEILPPEGPGGSLFWVIRGLILVRQRILAFEDAIGADGVRRCAIVLDPALVRVESRPRRAFQGWRYLAPGDAPPDLGPWRAGEEVPAALPEELEAALDAIGVVTPGR